MSRHDAYENEMRLRRPYDTDNAEFASLAEEIRSACLGAPGPDVQARHVHMILEQVGTVPGLPVLDPAAARRAKPVGGLVKLGIAAAGLALLTGSLALAGVDLPIFPDRAANKGAESGAQTSTDDSGGADENRSETARRVQATIEANLPLLNGGDISGCEFGAMVSAAARGVEPDTSGCEGNDGGEGEELGSGRGETAQRVRATIEENLPLLHGGDISGCEFGAMVSAAARGVEPDTSRCDHPDLGAGTGRKDSKPSKQKAGPAAEKSAPTGSSAPEKSQGKKQAADGGAPDDQGSPATKGKKAETKSEGEDEDKVKGTDKAPGLGKGKGKDAPPAGKPGGKSNGD